MQVHIICTKNKVPKQRDLISAALCMDSAGYKIETMQCFITVYMHAERVCKASPEVLITRPPACFCKLCCDQKLRYDLEWPKLWVSTPKCSSLYLTLTTNPTYIS